MTLLSHCILAGNAGWSGGLFQMTVTIHVSADTILQAFTKASLTSYSLNNWIDDRLASQKSHLLCLEKLEEMNDILRTVDYVYQEGEHQREVGTQPQKQIVLHGHFQGCFAGEIMIAASVD